MADTQLGFSSKLKIVIVPKDKIKVTKIKTLVFIIIEILNYP